MTAGVVLREGQTWESYRSTCVQDGSLIGTYVLEKLFEDFSGFRARLRNVETGGSRPDHSEDPPRRRVPETTWLLEVGGSVMFAVEVTYDRDLYGHRSILREFEEPEIAAQFFESEAEPPRKELALLIEELVTEGKIEDFNDETGKRVIARLLAPVGAASP